MATFSELIVRLDSTLRKFNPISYDKLQPPLPEAELVQLLEILNVEDSSFRELFSWKDGVPLTVDMRNRGDIFEFGMLMSLNSILQQIEKLWFFCPGMIPFIGRGDGAYFLFNNNKGEKHGRIHLFSASLLYTDKPLDYYDSVTTMIETTIAAYEKGFLEYLDGYLEVALDGLDPLTAELNPRSRLGT